MMLFERRVRHEFRDGVCHLDVAPGEDPEVMRSWLIPVINSIEARMPIAVHGVPFCAMPDAFELVVDGKEGIRSGSCNRCSLERTCSGFPKGWSVLEGPGAGPFDPSLREVAIELNRSCLFDCGFCFYRDSPDSRSKIMPLGDVLSLVDRIADAGVPSVRFFGGDPVLRPDFLRIVSRARERGLLVIVNTNGVFDDPAQRDVLARLSDLIVVSMHGHDEASAGALTGRQDLFRKVLASIRSISSQVPERLMVSTVVTPTLIRERDRYLRILSRMGVRRWSLNREMISAPAGNMSRGNASGVVSACSSAGLSEDPEVFADLAAWAADAARSSGIRIVMNDVPHCILNGRHRFLADHNAQTNSMTRLFCDIDGFFKPKPSFEVDLGRDLVTAWRKNPLRWSAKPPIPDECMGCSALMRCLGGSRSMACAATGDLNGKDPLMRGPI